MQTCEPHLHHPLPEGRLEAGFAFEDLAQGGSRAFALEELGDRLLQQLLFFGEIEVHFRALLLA